ncbi:MAG TPA: outer membrane protein assembly factor BamE [Rhodocyclaceae bacterium]|nr:outer membrane protein assembly factor BamE [Rhodocyclaceae bacterium]
MVSRSLFAACAIVALSACSYVPRIVTEYRIDIQQGNVITQEMVSQLKPGQTRDQVRFVLGTPMLTDVFHADRWDYLYRYQNGRTGAVEQRRFSVFFDKDGRLERATGDLQVASAAELNAPASTMQVIDLGSVPADGKPLPPPEEKGFFGRMLEKVGL